MTLKRCQLSSAHFPPSPSSWGFGSVNVTHFSVPPAGPLKQSSQATAPLPVVESKAPLPPSESDAPPTSTKPKTPPPAGKSTTFPLVAYGDDSDSDIDG